MAHSLFLNSYNLKNTLIMKNIKKVPNKQLEKFSNIFTQLGLVLVLFIVFISLEYKTEKQTVAILKNDFNEQTYIPQNETYVFVKETKVVPKTTVHKIKKIIIDNIEKGNNTVIETVIEQTTSLKFDANRIIEVNDFEPIIEDVPFINIEEAPVFKGCENLSKEENKKCFDRKMKAFVLRNFNPNLANDLGLHSGIHKIQTQFIIDQKGTVIDIKIRAPHKELKKETTKLLNKLPNFTPGKQRNKPVRVRYTLPIIFRVD